MKRAFKNIKIGKKKKNPIHLRMNVNDQQREARNRFPQLRVRAKKAEGCWMRHVQGAGCAGPYRVCVCVPLPNPAVPPKAPSPARLCCCPGEGRHLGLCQH